MVFHIIFDQIMWVISASFPAEGTFLVFFELMLNRKQP